MNTIYDGSFVLGQTSATNFVAGPGISIDSPSAGTVRIGNDETVLWSGTANVGTVMELNEPMANFEKVRLVNVYGQEYYHNAGANGGWWNPMTPSFYYGGSTSGTTTEIIIDRITFNSTATDTLTYNSNIDIKVSTAGALSVTNNVNNNTQRITKIIGINRISGSNA